MSLTADPCSVKPNNTPAADQAPLDADHTISHLLDELKNFWKQLPDPMDERILTRLQDLCSLTQDARFDLLNKYKSLVNSTGDDFNEIADGLIISTGDGHRALYWSIRGSLLAYRIAICRNTKAALTNISNAAADLVLLAENRKKQEIMDQIAMEHFSSTWKSMCADVTTLMEKVNTVNLDLSNVATDLILLAENRKKQEIMDQTAMEHFSSTWNSTCADVTALMEKVKTLNLNLSIPTSRDIVKSTVSPSDDSGSATSSYNPGEFRIPQYTVYENTHLSVHADQHGKLSLSTHSKTGTSLLGLNHLSSKVIKSLLNRDLIKLSEYIQVKNIDFTQYNQWTPEKKRITIGMIYGLVPSKSGQWVLNIVD